MSDAVIVGLLAAVASIIAAVLTSRATQNSVEESLKISNEVQNVKIEHLAEEQKGLKEELKKSNNYAQKIPVIEEQIKVVNHRVSDLERKVG